MTDSPALRPAPLALWFSIGLVVASGALLLQLTSPGAQLSDILRVGIESPAREYMSEELGSIRLAQGSGHDGQYSYLVARDPFALKGLWKMANDGGYRFRRALYGWLAGGFGLISPQGVLWGLAAWAIMGFGLATAALADIAAHVRARAWAVVGVLGNIGLWLSIQLATADALAMGLSLAGISLVLRRRTVAAAVAFTAAVLTKDTFLLFPLAVAGWMLSDREPRKAFAMAIPPIAALLLWSAWLQIQIGTAFSLKGNLGLPFVGLAEALPWLNRTDAVLGWLAISGLLFAITGVAFDRTRPTVWLAVPWIIIAVLSSHLVWENGNNAVRALAANWTLGCLMASEWVAQHDSTSLRNLPA